VWRLAPAPCDCRVQLCTQFDEEDMMEPLLHRKSLEDDVSVMDVSSLYKTLVSVRAR
jgi:hypothetical protein